MKTLSHKQLFDTIAASSGVLIVGILALIDARARKTGNPFGVTFKDISAVGFVGADYTKAVEREGARQGEKVEFDGGPLPWGVWALPNKVIEHRGGYYLRTQSTPGQRRKQAAKVLAYRNASGHVLDREKVKQFLPPVYESAKQQDEGLTETVWVRTYAFDSIKKIRIAGVTYKLEK